MHVIILKKSGAGEAINFTNIFGDILRAAPSGESILLETAATLRNDNTGKQEDPFSAKNIYDLGGNAGEWTTEYLKSNKTYRISGGSFLATSVYYIIDNNMSIYSSGTTGGIGTSSRPILYK
mgnify:FL=1